MLQRIGFGERRPMALSRPSVTFVRSTLAAACVIGTLALLLSRVSAQDARGEARQACKADYSRLCAGVSPGGGRIRKCFNDNFDSLSEACKRVVSATVEK